MALLLGLMIAAQAAPAADDAAGLFAGCPGGPPKTDVQGRRLDAGFWRRGPMLAVFWSPDCAFCQRHNERLGRLLRDAPDATVLGVAVDATVDAVRRTVERRGYAFPVIVDGQGDCALRPQLTSRRLVPMTCWLGDASASPRCIPGEMGEDDLRGLLRQSRASRHS
jgi:thiol-disulfide isomerase/thioredoxin